MLRPLVTIAIPTFNRADSYLGPCLESALGQTYENLEVLVSDNCSTDHTSELVRSFRDPRLRYVRQRENIGQNRNMNFLLDEARGDYFLMYHDDDRIDDDFVESCMNAVGFNPDVGLIVTGSRVVDQDGHVVSSKENPAGGRSTDEFILMWYQKQLQLFFCCSLFNTATLRRAGGFLRRYDHFDDVAAEFVCAARGGRADVREVKASFRVHSGSRTSASDIGAWCDSSLALLELARSLAPARARELGQIGFETSADRNYRLASLTGSKRAMCRAYWTVFRKFGYRRFPGQGYLVALAPPLRYLLKPGAVVRGVKRWMVARS